MITGQRIRNRRIELGMSQEQLAKSVGFKGKSMICYIEKSAKTTTIKNLEKIAKVLNCSPAYLAGWSEEVTA